MNHFAPRHTTIPLACLLLAACQSTSVPDDAIPKGAVPDTSEVAARFDSATIPGSVSGGAWSCSPRVELSSVWTFLSRKYDTDEDGRVTAIEYDRGPQRFQNYDRDGNGELTAADFPPDTFFNGFSHMLARQADGDGDSEISRAEWDAFASKLDGNADAEMTSAEVQAVMGDWAADWPLFLLSFDQDSDGDFDRTDLELTFRDQDFDGNGVLAGRETRGWMPTAERPTKAPPAVGEAAPDFELPRAENPTLTVRLADAVGKRPVALVFGSYT